MRITHWTGALALTGMAATAHATNGMNMEAWGDKSGGMGGAAFAMDSGNSALMSNPATLGLKPAGKSDLGLGLTLLMPDVKAGAGPVSVESDGTAYWMPTVSYIRRQGDLAFGVGMLAQGGMGTEYGVGSPLFAFGPSSDGVMRPMSGQEVRSEVGFGRVMFPLVWNARPDLSVAAQLDLVWGSMDMQMDMDGQNLVGMMNSGLVTGSLPLPSPATSRYDYARFDFSDNNPMTGKAKSYGWGYKLGGLWRVNEQLNLGATYHAKTRMGDMSADGATLTASGDFGTVPMTGKLKVLDFQWPEIFGLGMAYDSGAQWSMAADVKHIRWSDAMKDFRLRFANAGGDLNVTMPQNWKDQTVLALGVQYKLSPDVALRAGYNRASNPVPAATLNPLFPAIVESHYTLGVGYRIDPARTLAVSVALAPEVSQTSAQGITSSHGQTTLRVNYNHSF
jgi:long-chain fatty acid transport protein